MRNKSLLGIVLVFLFSQVATCKDRQPLPSKICQAKRVLLRAHNAETFDRARRGIPTVACWKVVEENPDIILEFGPGGIWKGGVSLAVLDGKTGQELWRDHQRTLFWRDTTDSLIRRLRERCPTCGENLQ